MYERSMKSQFKSVDRYNANYTVIIGDDEKENNTVTLKDNISKEQYSIAFDKLLEKLEELEKTHE